MIEANTETATLTEANIQTATLTEANIIETATLTEANIIETATLTEANIIETATLTDGHLGNIKNSGENSISREQSNQNKEGKSQTRFNWVCSEEIMKSATFLTPLAPA